MSQEFKREDWLAAKAGGGHVSHQEAAQALDSLDDYARMGTGVDAHGPRGMLERYIAQQAATLRQQAARVDGDTREYVLRAMALNYSEGHSWDRLDTEACSKAADEIASLRAALEAALSAQPAAERQGAVIPLVDCIGLALDLEQQAARVESQTVERAMLAAATGLRRLAHPSAPVGVPASPMHIDQQIEQLRTKYPQAHIQEGDDGVSLVVVPSVKLPAGYNQDTCTLLFTVRVYRCCIATAPEDFWIDSSQLALADGRKPAWSNTLNAIPGFPAWRDLTWFKWHLQAWSPHDCTLLSVVRAILQSLAAAPFAPQGTQQVEE